MKNFLCPTDFSDNAMHTSKYAHYLAKLIGADMLLCNAVTLPAYAPQAGVVVWPIEEEDLLIQDSNDELKRIKLILDKYSHEGTDKPDVRCICEPGSVKDVVNRISNKHHIDLIIAGTHGAGGLSTLILGNHSRQLIDDAKCPLLLVPQEAKTTAIKKIAFATDFSDPVNDLACLYTLISLARPLHSDILITHISPDESPSAEFQRTVKHFVTDISNKADYPHIYFREIKDDDVQSGLLWLCEYGNIDMLTMIHKSQSFLARLFGGSQTKKIAAHIPLPLLVFPEQLTKYPNVEVQTS
ncbi:MAG: universal stress protein UspE [Pedobacter sp.]|nr:universal stress protein UspE [Pedobacter sp.]